MYFFTADEHYGHGNILKFLDRPFATIQEHDAALIDRHNTVVSETDTVIHAGDFTLAGPQYARRILAALHGRHVFVRGSHDRWLKSWPAPVHEILELDIEGQRVVVCHYAMRIWPRSHYGAWLLHGHSHGKLPPWMTCPHCQTQIPFGRVLDVGVDGHGFAPVSWHKILEIMQGLPENPGLIRRRSDGRADRAPGESPAGD
ncbi:MAG: metallophosphoesterase family protein [Armatimonadia bacterium]